MARGVRTQLLARLVIRLLLTCQLEARRDDVNHAKASARANPHERLVGVLWQHVVGRALLEEEDARDLVALIEDVLGRGRDTILQQWTDPREEVLRLA